jgi:hypothetical protein
VIDSQLRILNSKSGENEAKRNGKRTARDAVGDGNEGDRGESTSGHDVRKPIRDFFIRGPAELALQIYHEMREAIKW